jgi:hypothetical protein
VLTGRAEPGGDQQRAELIAVQPGGVRLIVQPRTADMSSRGVIEEFLLEGVPVEPGDGAQAAGDGGPGPAARFQVAGEAFDVGAAGLEQADVVLPAPARLLAQVQRVRLARQAGVTGQEASQGQLLWAGEHRSGDGDCGGRGGCGRCHRIPSGLG